MFICFNDFASQKQELLISCKSERIDTCDKDEQCSNAFSPISVTDDGINICFNETQFRKELFPIDFTEEEIVTFSNTVQN